jgi:hypothetical protein
MTHKKETTQKLAAEIEEATITKPMTVEAKHESINEDLDLNDEDGYSDEGFEQSPRDDDQIIDEYGDSPSMR